MKLPGDALEKALADTLSAAGKALFAAVQKRLSAWALRSEAQAEVDAAKIRHEGRLSRRASAKVARRQEEIEDLEHERRLLEWAEKGRTSESELRKTAIQSIDNAKIDAVGREARASLQRSGELSNFDESERNKARHVIARGLGRTLTEIESGQHSVEWVIKAALHLLERDDERDKAREIDDEWLMRFFKYAAEVHDTLILEVLARALADAAIPSRPVISPRALDALRFLQPHTFEMFKFSARHLTMWSAAPVAYLELDPSPRFVGFDLSLLTEMGLLKVERQRSFGTNVGQLFISFTFSPGHRSDFELAKLTRIGLEIFGLVSPATRAADGVVGTTKDLQSAYHIQKALSISTIEAKNLAVAIVQILSDQSSFRIDAVCQGDTSLEAVISRERERLDEPFELNMRPSDLGLDGDNARLLEAFCAEFNYFDEHQLKTLAAHLGHTPAPSSR